MGSHPAEPPTLDALLARLIRSEVKAAVEEALRPIVKHIASIDARLPPQLVDTAGVCRATGLSPATVRRRVKDGSFPSVRVGRRVLVDLSKIGPVSDEEVARMANAARRTV